jgi:hypothetical protein
MIQLSLHQDLGHTRHQRRRRSIAHVCVYLSFLLIAVSGCFPEEHWLDDSSGFVYTVGKGATQEIRFYEISQKADRVVWSGSSKAGVDVDLAAHELYVIESRRPAVEGPLSCRLSAYGIKSNRLQRVTRWMPWNANNTNAGALGLVKLPNRQSHFLVRDPASNAICDSILNADAESLTCVPDFLLEVIPDGSGFLGRNLSAWNTWQESLRGKKKLDARAIEALCKESASIVDLSGIRQRITWDQSALRYAVGVYGEQLRIAESAAEPEKQSYNYIMFFGNALFGMPSGRPRDGSENRRGSGAQTMLIGQERGALKIDVSRRTITYVAGLTVPAVVDDSGVSHSLHFDPTALLIKLKNVEYRVNVLEQPSRTANFHLANLEARWPAEGRTKVLLSRVRITDIPGCREASPNGRFAVLRFQDAGSRIHFVIVDDAGNLVDRLFFHNVDDTTPPAMPGRQ